MTTKVVPKSSSAQSLSTSQTHSQVPQKAAAIQQMDGPLLSGSAEITLLSLIIAIAAFLRTLSVAAEDKIDIIQANPKSPVWPKNKDFTSDRVKILQSTHDRIESVTPFLFLLIILCAIRVTCHAFTLIYPDIIPKFVFFWADLALVASLACMTVGMFWAHFALKPEDRRVRREKNLHLETQSEPSQIAPVAMETVNSTRVV